MTSPFLPPPPARPAGEAQLEVEHRDLHLSNILVLPTEEEAVAYKIPNDDDGDDREELVEHRVEGRTGGRDKIRACEGSMLSSVSCVFDLFVKGKRKPFERRGECVLQVWFNAYLLG